MASPLDAFLRSHTHREAGLACTFESAEAAYLKLKLNNHYDDSIFTPFVSQNMDQAGLGHRLKSFLSRSCATDSEVFDQILCRGRLKACGLHRTVTFGLPIQGSYEPVAVGHPRASGHMYTKQKWKGVNFLERRTEQWRSGACG